MSIFEQKIIDTHHHLWEPTSQKYDWLIKTNHSQLNKKYLIEDLVKDFNSLKIDKSVHVQAEINTDEMIYETKWLQEISDNNQGFPNAIIGFVDIMDSEVEKKLQQHLNFSNFRGIRQILKFDKNNTKASHTKIDYLNQDVWLKNISLLQKYNLSFDLLILVSQTENAIKLIKKYPNVLFIINHSLSPLKFDNESLEDWRKKITLLSDHENIIIKLSGFGEFNPSWTEETIKPLILYSIDKFGIDRCMFGTNFPVDKFLSSSIYTDYWNSYYNIVKNFSSNEKNKLFYINAEKYYKI